MDGPSLPRSMRWRLQLGVFKLPPLFIPGNEVVEGEEELLKWSFSDLWQCNSDICQELRWEYTRLKQEWMVFRSEQQSQSLSLTENNKEQQSSNLSSSTGSLSLLDPLSAFAKEKTAEKKRLEELELKYKREKALRKRGMYNEDDDDNDNENEYSSFAVCKISKKNVEIFGIFLTYFFIFLFKVKFKSNRKGFKSITTGSS